MKYKPEELEAAYAELNSKANPVYAFVGALIGAFPALALYLFYGEMGGALYIMLALPPLIIGFSAKYIGRVFAAKHRLTVGLVGSIVHVLGCYLVQFDPLVYLLALAAFAVTFTTAKVKLNPIETYALAAASFGKININQ